MLGAGDPLPSARVWAGPLEEPVELGEAVAGPGRALLCFYPFDWSPTCANELRLLHDRRGDLAAARVRPFGISLDSPWSQQAFARSLGVEGSIPLLSDRTGEAARGFGVMGSVRGMERPDRSAFLVMGDTVVASWMLRQELPDVDAIVAAASSS